VDFDLDHGPQVLASTPAVLRALLADLDDGWTRTNTGPETFSPYDVVGHLIDGERTDWLPRVRTILEHGEQRPFAPFDRFAMWQWSQGRSLACLLDEFAALRADNLAALRALALAPADLVRRGTHPELGTVTLGQLLATWVAHDLDHLGQIARTMAFQYCSAVGPWQACLSILPQAAP
jgi:hypothetical protein